MDKVIICPFCEQRIRLEFPKEGDKFKCAYCNKVLAYQTISKQPPAYQKKVTGSVWYFDWWKAYLSAFLVGVIGFFFYFISLEKAIIFSRKSSPTALGILILGCLGVFLIKGVRKKKTKRQKYPQKLKLGHESNGQVGISYRIDDEQAHKGYNQALVIWCLCAFVLICALIVGVIIWAQLGSNWFILPFSAIIIMLFGAFTSRIFTIYLLSVGSIIILIKEKQSLLVVTISFLVASAFSIIGNRIMVSLKNTNSSRQKTNLWEF